MNKISVPVTNDFCPQTLFIYGTYKEDGTPNFGLFCWLSYYWDGELGVMASIGGNKLTKERIQATNVFSANLVTEQMLPLADYFGNKKGYENGKMDIDCKTERGEVLNVPVLSCSPICFELEVAKTIPLDNGEVYLCKIRNLLMEENLLNTEKSIEERLGDIAPISTTCATYFSWNGKSLGDWGTPKNLLLL